MKKEIYKQCIEKWGVKAQLGMLAEECIECSLAVYHFVRREEDSFTNLMSEMADVEIMLEQMKIMLCVGTDKYAFRMAKVKKLKRIKEHLETKDGLEYGDLNEN